MKILCFLFGHIWKYDFPKSIFLPIKSKCQRCGLDSELNFKTHEWDN